jgi:hypothetical protein
MLQSYKKESYNLVSATHYLGSVTFRVGLFTSEVNKNVRLPPPTTRYHGMTGRADPAPTVHTLDAIQRLADAEIVNHE